VGQIRSRQIVQSYLADVLGGGAIGRAIELIGDETLRRRVKTFRGAFPDLRVRIRQIVAQDDMVAVRLVGSGPHHGVFHGCPPTGRSWEATCTAIYHVDDGRITRAWVNWDLVAVMEQIGCIERAATASA
jgi:steroid delta-isomerase-like uncharacterized protein